MHLNGMVVTIGGLLLLLISKAMGQPINLSSVTRFGLEISELSVNDEIDSIQVNQVTTIYDLALPKSFEEKLKSAIRIGKKLKMEEMDGCLDGLGHDVSIVLIFQDESRSEIFYGCDDYRNGTLRIGNDYSKFWKVTIDPGFLNEFEAYIKKAKSRIAGKRKTD